MHQWQTRNGRYSLLAMGGSKSMTISTTGQCELLTATPPSSIKNNLVVHALLLYTTH